MIQGVGPGSGERIRRANLGDAAVLGLLYDRYLNAGQASAALLGQGKWKEILQELIESPSHCILVYEIGGEIASTACLAPMGSGSSIENVVTAPQYRRRGLAGALAKELIALSRAHGSSYVCVVPGGKDPRGASSFYESLGFRRAYPLSHEMRLALQ
jgi:ribosomal protein S18 acetylase RimI-like enzyme